MDNNKYVTLKTIISNSNNIVCFTGAGTSTESGIKDFRSVDGLYNMKYKYPPEEILSHTFFFNHTEEFYDFYKNKLNSLDKTPNSFHKYLKELQDIGKLKTVITQNIDGLDIKAGIKNVYEIHGTIYKNKCIKCGKKYSALYVFNSLGIPKCSCGSIIKPEVILYEEKLNEQLINDSIKAISNADLLIVVGTSLQVYPANGFINYFNGKYLIIINSDPTPYDYIADIVIHDELKYVIEKLKSL